ncbi:MULTISPECIES: gamma-glutamyl-gamma-aminobutyrate hydrolase family protein [unclassified Streptomyces]|uniref:gamma-glutamyl-gamma-aminobutyrate hydrolase family protein n=1 Tax=Streptomyces TaxID=1883 RepID=UPI0001C1BB00|nr:MULTISPECIES: gamma-glutamyl-gamma-aminobutyrate hydrolase family protein [unclassified Streptomyces]AEN08962.1 peptidase C26 [Streptomyces sp. SirexAA-E]MYR69042.1 gamma-glutamyl-gamma-aminobutyrate hydrolase family protein [Streptomyces sp. SID4939]MYS00442.1 gamma-glutamyl-gamma-aminobutyrate hydrolase family protein [Streptomyces sp. SID4940]MYT63951.1 gamma-glutamyl-gamma-aminobutyrate hydrolase family protein [Streptomyces sp. SID8357]MYT89317.1 gamma-glutamyl-gamma-aminobutyrate hydr
MHEPLIGITTYLEPAARWGVWELPAAVLPSAYPQLVQRSGGLAALLPPDEAERAATVVARLDGLVIAGGADIDPELYGAERDFRTGPPAHERDTWEVALLRAAMAAGVPVLGICRGMQLLNVALGGTLTQHLDGHTGPFGKAGVLGEHPVVPVPGTRYASLVPEETSVPTYHHQAVERLAPGLVVSAHAADGTVEAVELPGGTPWVMGVQWHPEMGDDLRVMRALVDAARTAAATRATAEPSVTAPA